MELTYVGGHDAVLVPMPGGAEPLVEHGSSFDFPDTFAERLLEQPDNWQPTKPEVPLDERIAAIKTHEDANAVGAELGLDLAGKTPSLTEKKAAIDAAVAASDSGGIDDNAGDAGEGADD